MRRLPIFFISSLVIFWAMVAVAWAIGLTVSCAFIEGCYEKLSIIELMKLMDFKSVFVRGTLLSLVFTVFAWAKLRRT